MKKHLQELLIKQGWSSDVHDNLKFNSYRLISDTSDWYILFYLEERIVDIHNPEKHLAQWTLSLIQKIMAMNDDVTKNRLSHYNQ